MNNDLINELNNKIDAQDKIINEQVLEIARLNKQLNCKERLTKLLPPDTEFIILSKSVYERQEKDIEEIALELQDKIDKAIEYINNCIKSFDTKILNSNEIDELIKILGEKGKEGE